MGGEVTDLEIVTAERDVARAEAAALLVEVAEIKAAASSVLRSFPSGPIYADRCKHLETLI